MIDKRTIVHKLATKYNLPLEVVADIVNYQFKFVSKIMKEGDFEAIRLPYFGKFSVNPNRVKYITKLKDEATR
jgi:nucleoid DNA-binding protein